MQQTKVSVSCGVIGSLEFEIYVNNSRGLAGRSSSSVLCSCRSGDITVCALFSTATEAAFVAVIKVNVHLEQKPLVP